MPGDDGEATGPQPFAITPEVRAAAERLAVVALVRVQEQPTGRVRAEDYLTVLGSITGEAALVSAGLFDIESSELTPGSAVFGDQINHILSGDTPDLAAVAPDSVVGLLVRELVPAVVPLDYFGSLETLYRNVAAKVGSLAWGAVYTSVPDENEPSVLPLQVAFELRPAVDFAVSACGLTSGRRYVVCALALADGLREVQGAIDLRVGILLALEVVFGMAKMTPMSKRAFEAEAEPGVG